MTRATLLEHQKLRKYPGIKCQPFVVEALGRMGDQATRFLRGLARDLDADARGPTISRWYQALSVALQVFFNLQCLWPTLKRALAELTEECARVNLPAGG